MEFIETERLISRRFIPDDSEFILELLNTEGWIRYIGDRNVRTTEQAKSYLENGALKSYETNGFGLNLVQLKENNKPIGMCGLIKRDYLDHPDIGFAFLPDYSGKGYAYEIAKRVIDYGLNQIQLKKILAITLPENFPSIKLLKKLGFSYEKNFVSADTNEELSLYSIKKEN
jgi:RimJ/RimL family protein N-acetyltransferase